jgi:hypothetical protein
MALENANDFLNRVTAGVRAATLNKLLYDEYETAIILGTSTETLKQWRRKGEGPAWIRLGEKKLVRYPFTGLLDHVDELQQEQHGAVAIEDASGSDGEAEQEADPSNDQM